MGYTQLFSSIVASSIWCENEKTRVVWITLLAICERDDIAYCSIGGLARLANVGLEDCQKAIEVLSSPDTDDSSGIDEGRRIRKAEGGFFIINRARYRDKAVSEERRKYQAEWMKNKRRLSTLTNIDTSETETKTETEKTFMNKRPTAPPPTAKINGEFPTRPENVQEVIEFCLGTLALTENDAKALRQHWRGNGLKVNGKPMNSWKHTASNWQRRSMFFPSLLNPPQPKLGFL